MPRESQRLKCKAVRKDGKPCTARSVRDHFCVGHLPEAQEARRKGGRNSARTARLGKFLPSQLRPVFTALASALEEVHEGSLDPRAASAMASVAGAIVRVITSGELEERMRTLEDRVK